MNRSLVRLALVVSLTTLTAFIGAASAGASYHLNKIREITGDTLGGNQSYIELQAYGAGENLVSGHKITVWDETGAFMGNPGPLASFTLTGANPPNGANQSTILIGDTGVANADFTIPELSAYLEDQPGQDLVQGGAVCYEGIPIDCVSWGQNFIGASNLPDHTVGNGSNMPTGILALRRAIGANCATALDAADDTDNAANDFALTGANPRPNSVAPTETVCPPGNPNSPTNPAGHTRQRKCKKKQKSSAGVAKKKKCKRKGHR